MPEQENKNPFLKNLFKNAAVSSTKFTLNPSGMDSRKCPSCNAARPADTDIRTCAYCGYLFMSDEVIIKNKDCE